MGTGILFLVITGIMWVGVGGIISSTAEKQLNLALIQGGGALLIVLAGVPAMIWDSNSIHTLPLIALPAAGILNYIVFYFMEKAMGKGPNGLIWAMVQSAFLMSFLMGATGYPIATGTTISAFLVYTAFRLKERLHCRLWPESCFVWQVSS